MVTINESNELSKKVQESEWIGVIGSPSSNTAFAIDVIEGAYEKGLVGNFCVVELTQDGKPAYTIGQVITTVLTNPYLERHSVRKIVSVRGEAPPLSGERHDVRGMEVAVGSAYCWDNGIVSPITIRTVPSTGTRAYLLNQDIVDELTKRERNEIFYIGKIYNTEINLPSIFRHFGPPQEGGLGEAYHLGVFGKTGSGKSVLTKMLLTVYGKHKMMSMIILDSTGEYSRETKEGGNLNRFMQRLGRTADVYDIAHISLRRFDALRRIIIVSGFLDMLGVRAAENKEYAADLTIEFFQRHKEIVLATGERIKTLENAWKREVFEQLADYVGANLRRIYVAQEPQERVRDYLSDRNRLFAEWSPIARLFSEEPDKIPVDEILSEAYDRKKVIFIDISGEVQTRQIFWNEKVKVIVLKEIIGSLEDVGGRYYREGKFLNLLVAIDEAHRFVPRETPQDEDFEALKAQLVDCVRTTRKYGLGWLFISQSLASLDLEILRQMRLYFIGYGLSWGTELRTLQDLVGGGAYVQLYQSFRDPQTSAIYGEKQYPFMVSGPVSPLSISGAPMYFNALDYYDEFAKTNGLV